MKKFVCLLLALILGTFSAMAQPAFDLEAQSATVCQALLTGDFIAMEIKSNTSEDTYRLFKLDEESDENIGVTITADTYPEYRHFMMEGKDEMRLM